MLTTILILSGLILLYQWGAVKELQELNKDIDRLIEELNKFSESQNLNHTLNHMRVDHIEERLTDIQARINLSH